MTAPLCRKAVVSEDGRSITVYYNGREYKIEPGFNGVFKVSYPQNPYRLFYGADVWGALELAEKTLFTTILEARP